MVNIEITIFHYLIELRPSAEVYSNSVLTIKGILTVLKRNVYSKNICHIIGEKKE
jgi:hypothetical protein